ncbi:MAG: hypothetical protein [Microviridae sp.]|nr:MAG: hypothetical protein [Microviridae sp.]
MFFLYSNCCLSLHTATHALAAHIPSSPISSFISFSISFIIPNALSVIVSNSAHVFFMLFFIVFCFCLHKYTTPISMFHVNHC